MAGTEREIDTATNTETTGHEWDGIKELDTPMPRWWLLTFYATIIWAVIYTILMPAWPLVKGATPGLLGYSSRANVAEDIAEFRERTAPLDDKLMSVELASVADDAELLHYATSGGGAVFRNHCSQCHGSGAAGGIGYPNLVDDAWLWGGTVDDIALTVTHGIRYEEDDDTRYSEMPAFGEMLEDDEIDNLIAYVMSLSAMEHEGGDLDAGAVAFEENCAACHGEDGTGMIELGAPNLTDGIWLYGGSEDDIRHSIEYARYGIMPSFRGRISETDIRKAAVYVHTLGGGQ